MKRLLQLTWQISFLISFAILVKAENLHEVIEQSVLTNPAILEKYNQKISREYEVKVANAGYLPVIEVNAGGGYKRTESDTTRNFGDGNSVSYRELKAGISLKQMLFDGYLTSSEKARQQKRVESAFFELYNLAEEIAVSAVEVYANVLLYQTYVDFAKDNLKSHEKMFDQIETFSDQIHQKFQHIDILINNAGIFQTTKEILKNGLEKTFMVNYLSAFILTLSLHDLLKKAMYLKIINLSSMIHAGSIDFGNLNCQKSFSGESAYSVSKLCNILFSYELAEKLNSQNILINALHPGVINTKLLRAGWGPLGSSLSEGAKRILFLVKDELEEVTGKYFENDQVVKSAEISYNEAIRKQLWGISMSWANQFLKKNLSL